MDSQRKRRFFSSFRWLSILFVYIYSGFVNQCKTKSLWMICFFKCGYLYTEVPSPGLHHATQGEVTQEG